MKLHSYIISAILLIAAASFTACDKFEGADGDTSTIKGKTGMLTVNLTDSKLKTRAYAEGPMSTDTIENAIQSFTLWILRSGNVVASLYKGSDIHTTFTMAIPADADSVLMVVNRGDLRDDTNITTSAAIRALTTTIGTVSFIDVNGDGKYLGDLCHSGEQKIVWVSGAADVVIQLGYIPARISVEKVTLFGENVYIDTDLSSTGKAAMAAQGISSMAITTVFLINGKDDSYIFPQSGNSSRVADGTYYYGFGAALSGDFNWPVPGNAFYPTSGWGPYSPVGDNVNFGMGTVTIYKPISLTTFYPIFYLAENSDKGSNAGLSCVVIGCDVALTGSNDGSGNPVITPMFYTIPLSALSTGVTGYSVKSGYHYHITADISGIGSDNPYNPVANYAPFAFTIVPSGWNVVNQDGSNMLP